MAEMKYTEEYWKDIDKVINQIKDINKLYGRDILLTGATGMLVSPVVDIIFRVNQLYHANIKINIASRDIQKVKSRFPHMEVGRDFEWLYFDSAVDADTIKCRTDYIIHGASYASPHLYSKYPIETILGNIYGTNALLKLLHEKGKGRMLYISSSEVYGKREDHVKYSENSFGSIECLNVRAGYPNAKRVAENLCVAYSEEHGLDIVVARPGHIYGPTITPTDDRASAQFTRCVAAGKDIVLKSAGTQRRSYCYILDCASALFTILINGKKNEAYNIANRKSNVMLRELAEEFAKIANLHICYQNPSDVELKGYNLMDDSALDATKLETLGWQAIFNLTEGIKRTIEYYD